MNDSAYDVTISQDYCMMNQKGVFSLEKNVGRVDQIIRYVVAVVLTILPLCLQLGGY